MDWRWTFVWCGVCNAEIVVLGRRWIKHTDPRPECIVCKVTRIMDKIGWKQLI